MDFVSNYVIGHSDSERNDSVGTGEDVEDQSIMSYMLIINKNGYGSQEKAMKVSQYQ